MCVITSRREPSVLDGKAGSRSRHGPQEADCHHALPPGFNRPVEPKDSSRNASSRHRCHVRERPESPPAPGIRNLLRGTAPVGQVASGLNKLLEKSNPSRAKQFAEKRILRQFTPFDELRINNLRGKIRAKTSRNYYLGSFFSKL